MARSRRSSRRRSTRSQREVRKKNIIGVVLIVLVIAASSAFGYFYYTAERLVLNPETGCPHDGAVALTVVVIDGSDPITPRQQAFLRNHLESIKEEIPHHGALEVYALGSDMESLLEPVVSVCNPGRGRDVNPLTGSPRRAEQLWRDAFQLPLQQVFDRMLDPDEADWSPIFESVQSIGITAFNGPQWQGKPRRLVLISDLLQYTPEFSHYQGPGEFEAFSRTAYFRKVRTNLSGVEVSVFYVPRETRNNVQGRRHLDFWKDYFLDQGARPGRPALFVQVEG